MAINMEKGFSLFELLTVIAIIGIISAIAVPNFIAHGETIQWSSPAAFNLKADLEKKQK